MEEALSLTLHIVEGP